MSTDTHQAAAEHAAIIARHSRLLRVIRRPDTALELREDPASVTGSRIVTMGDRVLVCGGIEATSYFEARARQRVPSGVREHDKGSF